MHTLQRSYRGFSLVLELNSDRILFVVTLAAALLAGAFLASI
ncbi:hypothetical protein [Sedimentitalea nanhaiensis]|uniref:Uncharacterized protein n=1 Tax=Sedimentitalea nanhaiensis TaxID=999627 RepID=A0A1I7DS44_9RHOB|nr:hypothetical protein [Sedimentitalea nanhaiensis]SFU14469.1 hypothetical protein SAMN05216236_13323 [Sedimentitalea nanhaiensis]